MKLYTIGFTQKSAERFYTLLGENGIERVVDTRLKPSGQLAGFAKGSDLAWFLWQLYGCDYVHLPELAPTSEILDDYRQDHDWARYVRRFEALMDERDIPAAIDRAAFEQSASCLLCSEPTPDQCHRRLVAERLARAWPDVDVVHLV
ncbi:MAG: DUF488 domain-containing protein [Thermomicrobiales bacterium]|nr:DUF488 domain-containing protein [Thermomicrobiales bacterium]